MIYSVLLLAASAAAVSAAGPTYNSTSGIFTCPADNPNGAYCAGDSLVTNIIIRCHKGIGQPGNCNDNLAGSFPMGVNYSPCWQSSPDTGDAACSKNCIVYGGSGNANGTFTLPGCTPSATQSTSSTASTLTSSSTSASVSVSTTSSPVPTSSATASTTITSTVTTTCVTDGTTTTQTYTTTYCPTSTLSTVTIPLVTGSTSASSSNNGTITTSGGSSGGKGGSATATPVGPTTTRSPTSDFTGAAISNSAGAGLAAVGLIFALFL